MLSLFDAATLEVAVSLAQVVSSQVEESFRWLRLPPAWVVVLVILPLVVAFVVFFYRRENPAVGTGPRGSDSAGWRWGLGILRVLVLLAVLAMLAQPVQRRTTYETRDSSLLVLLDDSLSMEIVDRYSRREIPEKLAELFGTTTEFIESTSRYDLIRRLLDDENLGFLKKLREKGKVIVSTFAKSVEEKGRLRRSRDDDGDGDEGRGARAAPDGSADALLPPYDEVRNDSRVQETRIAEGLRDAVSSVIGSGFGADEEIVSGVVLVSDGQENSGSASAGEVARRLRGKGTHVYTVGIGNPDEPKDLRIVNVDVNEIVLVDDHVPFVVSVVAEGFDGERVPISIFLKIESQTVKEKSISLDGDGTRQTVQLDYRPRKPGEFTATVEIDKLGGEVFYDNNSMSKTIRVLDEKIKVLYAENLPRYEYRYLKNSLIRDSTMESHVWLFSADPEFVQESSHSVPSLRSFPRKRAELFRYHVIILGDVDPDDLGEDVMGILKDFVFEGGGLVFISGRNANPSRYLHTDLFAALPVRVTEAERFGVVSQRPVTDSFKVELTPEGKELPVMRLSNDRDQNVFLWEHEGERLFEGLPSFYSFVRAEKEKPGAVVLARHPREVDPIQRQRRVIFAYMNYGKGRSFFSAVDNTWRWRAGVGNKYFGRFWGQVVRFTATGRLFGKTPRRSVTTDKSVYNIGETVKIDARVFDVNMKPSTEKSVTLYYQSQGREGESPEKVDLVLNEIKGQGAYEGAMTAFQRGRHDIWLGSETERLAFRFFTVEIPVLESRDPKLNRTSLEKIALASGGQYHDFYDVMRAVDKVQGVTRAPEGLVENDDLWDEWWVVLLFTALISVEWILRKAVRLL